MEDYLIYINLDGFGRYYFDAVADKRAFLPNLMALIDDGVFFESAYTGIPSITYPMQSSIVSGAYSLKTGNCFQYLDRKKNEIILQRRYNRAQTIGELLREQQIPFISIQQFTLEDRGSEYKNRDYLYVQPRGDFATRFRMLCRLIREGALTFQGETYRYDTLPHAIFMYVDDLDSIGHNPDYYSAYDERERQDNVVGHLQQIDGAIGDLIRALRERGIYERTLLCLTTDHGMISYQGKSLAGELIDALHGMGLERICAHGPGVLPQGSYDAILTSHDIQAQLYLENPHTDLEALRRKIEALPFVEQVLTRGELVERGVTPLYADLLISPVEGGYFSVEKESVGRLCATHDSLHEKCQHIFATMKGPKFMRGHVCREKIYNIDLMPTALAALGLPPLREASGRVLGSIFRPE